MQNFIIKILPQVVIRRIVKLCKPFYKAYWENVLSQIPNYSLEEKHLKNLKVLVNRFELLKHLPRNAIVAEIGVDEAKFSEKILEINMPKKLHLIDFWGSKRYNMEKRKKVESKFANQIKEKSVEINLGLSTQVVHGFPEKYFDWIYIDTSHSYKITIEELEAYQSKVKENGIIAGHDFVMGNWQGLIKYGVIEAVYEFCVKYNWEIIYLTSELKENASFAIRRIRTK